jgi:hypothetical protein
VILRDSYLRVVLGIEVEDDRRAAQSGQPYALARVADEVEVGSRAAFFDHPASVRNVRVPTVLGLHELNAVLVIAVNLLAFGWGGIYLWRKSYPGRLYAHALALGQSLLIAQVALGLLLLSDGRRAPDKLHYAYGTFALLAALSPWLYAPPVPARRLAWFVGATLLATALSIRAFTTA